MRQRRRRPLGPELEDDNPNMRRAIAAALALALVFFLFRHRYTHPIFEPETKLAEEPHPRSELPGWDARHAFYVKQAEEGRTGKVCQQLLVPTPVLPRFA